MRSGSLFHKLVWPAVASERSELGKGSRAPLVLLFIDVDFLLLVSKTPRGPKLSAHHRWPLDCLRSGVEWNDENKSLMITGCVAEDKRSQNKHSKA